MGTFVLSSTGIGGTPLPPAPAPPGITASPEFTGTGTAASPLSLAQGGINYDKLQSWNYPGVLGVESAGMPVAPIELGQGLVFAANRLEVSLTPGTLPIEVDQDEFTGDGSTTDPLGLKTGGIRVSKIEGIASKTLIGNRYPLSYVPQEVNVGRGLDMDLNGLFVNIGPGITINPLGQLSVDTSTLTGLLDEVHHTAIFTGTGYVSDPLDIGLGSLPLNRVETIPGRHILGNDGNNPASPIPIRVHAPLQIQNNELGLDPAFTQFFSINGHTHDAGEIVSGTLSTDRLPTLPLEKIARDTGSIIASDQWMLVWDTNAGQWIPIAPGQWFNNLAAAGIGMAGGTLDTLGDTNIVMPQDRDVLSYQASSGKWVNVPDQRGLNGGGP